MTGVGEGRRAVAIGGGTGIPSVLRCLLDAGFETSAVVTMADDGGSTGVLRRQLGILPPGDIRNCLVGMSADESGLLPQVFQYRFPHGEGLAGHALGNLVLAALTDITGSFPEAIDAAGAYLGARGRVLPSTLNDVVLHGTDRTGQPISGQARIAVHEGPVAEVCIEPREAEAYGPAIEALRAADVIVIGPGSLYTSIIPNFLVRDVAEAVRGSSARVVYICNVANMLGETRGLDAADHVRALIDHGLGSGIDVALVHVPEQGAEIAGEGSAEPVEAGPGQLAEIRELGIEVVTADLAESDDPARHDRERLCAALEEVV